MTVHRRFRLGRAALVAALTSASAPALAHSAAADAGWLQLSGFAGNDGFAKGEVDAFIPAVRTQSSLIFVDINGQAYDRGAYGGSLLFGYRQSVGGGWTIGGYLGAQVDSSSAGATFYQAAGGVDAISGLFAFDANVYLPTQHRRNAGSSVDVATESTETPFGQVLLLAGGHPLLSTAGEVETTTTTTVASMSLLAYRGFDAEAGIHRSLEQLFDTTTKGEARLYVGGFYFRNDDGAGTLPGLPDGRVLAGPSVRFELTFDEIFQRAQLGLEAQYAHDRVRGDQGYLGIRLRIPLGGSQDGASEESDRGDRTRLYERIRRETRIVTHTRSDRSVTVTTDTAETSTGDEQIRDVATGVTLANFISVNARDDVNAKAAAAGPGTLIALDGNAGPIAGGIALQPGQTLVGGGSVLAIQGVTTGTLSTFSNAIEIRPTIVAATGTALSIAGDSHVLGVDLRGGSGNTGAQIVGNDGISVTSGATNVVIETSTISGFGGNGITFGGTESQVRIKNNMISNLVGFGVFVGSGDKSIAITDNSFSDLDFDAVTVGSNNTAITISNNAISNIVFRATGFGGIGGIGDAPDGLSFGDGNQVAIANNTLSNIGASAIVFGSMNTVAVTGNTLANVGGNVFFAGSLDFSPPFGAGGPFAIVFGDSNTGTVANNTFTGPITTAAIGTFSVAHSGSTQGTLNTLTGDGNILQGTPKPTPCGNIDAAHNPATAIRFTDGSQCN